MRQRIMSKFSDTLGRANHVNFQCVQILYYLSKVASIYFASIILEVYRNEEQKEKERKRNEKKKTNKKKTNKKTQKKHKRKKKTNKNTKQTKHKTNKKVNKQTTTNTQTNHQQQFLIFVAPKSNLVYKPKNTG